MYSHRNLLVMKNKLFFVFTRFIAVIIVGYLLLQLVFFFWSPKSIFDLTQRRMWDFSPLGVVVNDKTICLDDLSKINLRLINDNHKKIISSYLTKGHKRYLPCHVASSFYIVGKYNKGNKNAAFGVILDDSGNLVGIDISLDNASVGMKSDRLVIVNSSTGLAREITEMGKSSK